jgi:hypothetical protein
MKEQDRDGGWTKNVLGGLKPFFIYTISTFVNALMLQ